MLMYHFYYVPLSSSLTRHSSICGPRISILRRLLSRYLSCRTVSQDLLVVMVSSRVFPTRGLGLPFSAIVRAWAEAKAVFQFLKQQHTFWKARSNLFSADKNSDNPINQPNRSIAGFHDFRSHTICRLEGLKRWSGGYVPPKVHSSTAYNHLIISSFKLSTIGSRAFLVGVAANKAWNALPDKVVSASSVDSGTNWKLRRQFCCWHFV